MRRVLQDSFVAAVCAICVSSAGAAELTILNTFNFLDVRQSNNVDIAAGTFLSFGANVSPPDGTVVDPMGTSVVAQQGATIRSVPYLFSPASPQEFFRRIPYDVNLTGSWTITATNTSPGVTGSPAVATTSSVGASTTAPQFVTDVAVTGGGTTPTLSWVQPGPTPDRQTIRIWDLVNLTPTGSPTLIHREFLTGGQTNYSLPATLSSGLQLQSGGRYAIGIEVDDLGPTGGLLAKSRSFVEFSPISNPNAIFLPVVLQDTNPNDNFGAPYQFNVSVTEGQPILIDPFVAIGYDYMIGDGDPLFQSVELPNIGDPSFDLYLWDGDSYEFEIALAPDIEFDFGAGVDRFRILGINPNLGLDPANTTAFVTELTFVADGRFTGTMTPIIAAVPEPSTLALFGLALAGIVFIRRYRRA